jgi:hypothetical protein
VIRLLDSVVADWGYYDWFCDDELIRQVRVQLFNGMTFIMDEADFWSITDYEAM